jgi:cytochrome c oxidase subunit 1
MHGLAIMGGVEAKLRAGGATGLFGWLKRVRWSSYGPAALAGSLIIFAIGGWSGTVETTLPLNLVNHNTMGVPAHLHSTVVGGMTLAFMGFAYYLVPLLTGRQLWGGRLATVQAYGYTAALLILIFAQTWAGVIGVPRRTQSADYGEGLPSGWDASMNLNGIGAALAATMGGLFIVIMVMSLLVGKKTSRPEELVPSGIG